MGKIHNALRVKVREADGRRVAPTAGLVDSQSVRAADTVPTETSGFDAGKKTKGRKRFIVTDTLGLLQAVHVAAVSVQDRDGARRPLLWARLDQPTVETIWADQGFGGRLVT
ncbi:transposase [Streptomyces mangrovi]|uniref:transposase n=1 Tax=Streptomyces mangrovi TaxID=1206892 RepID=UPI00399D4A64